MAVSCPVHRVQLKGGTKIPLAVSECMLKGVSSLHQPLARYFPLSKESEYIAFSHPSS